MFFLHISSSYAKILGGNYFAHGRFPEVGQKQKTERKERKREKYSRDCGRPRRPWPNASRKKQKKLPENQIFFRKKIKFTPKIFFFCIYLLVKPKYWGEIISHMGDSPKWVKSKRRRGKKKKKKEEIEKDWTMVITMAKLRMAHAWRTQAAWAKICSLNF